MLEHNFRFDWKNELYVVQGLAQAQLRYGPGSRKDSPANAEFTAPLQAQLRTAAIPQVQAGPLHIPLERFCLGKTESQVGKAASPLPAGYFQTARSRARKGAENKIQTRKPCLHNLPRARSGLRALPTLCVSTVKDWRRSFWSAVLQHRFCFGWRDDFHVVPSFVQAEPRWVAGSDKAWPTGCRIYCAPGWTRAVATAFLRCVSGRCGPAPSGFPSTVLLCQNVISGRAGSPLPAGYFQTARSRARKGAENKIQTCKPRPHNLPRRAVDCAPYLNAASARLCAKKCGPMRPCVSTNTTKFFGGDTAPEEPGRCGRATVVVLWRAALLAAGLLRPGQSRAGLDLSAVILAAGLLRPRGARAAPTRFCSADPPGVGVGRRTLTLRVCGVTQQR